MDIQKILSDYLDSQTSLPKDLFEESPEIGYKNEKKRSKDIDLFDVKSNLRQIVTSLIDLRKDYATKIYWLLVGSVIFTAIIIALQGFGLIKLDQGFLFVFVESIVVQTIYLVRLVVNDLFPNKDLIGSLSKFIGKKEEEQ